MQTMEPEDRRHMKLILMQFTVVQPVPVEYQLCWKGQKWNIKAVSPYLNQ